MQPVEPFDTTDTATQDAQDTGVHPECLAYFEDYVATHGKQPGRNQMARDLADSGLPERLVKRNWQSLTGPTRREVPTLDTLAEQLASLRAEVQDLRAEQLQLRELVTVLSPKPANGTPSDLREVTHALGQFQARLHTQEERLRVAEGQRQAEHTRLASIDAETKPLREFWQLLCRDTDAWQTWRVMLRSCSNWSEKVLLKFFTESTGHELEQNDKVMR